MDAAPRYRGTNIPDPQIPSKCANVFIVQNMISLRQRPIFKKAISF